jgi:hypothetical protein
MTIQGQFMSVKLYFAPKIIGYFVGFVIITTDGTIEYGRTKDKEFFR